MKKVLIIVGGVVVGLVVLIAGIIGLVFWFTGGAVQAGEEFLALVAQEQIEEAYDSTAAAFRSQQDPDSFEAVVRAIGLTGYASASWSGREIQNDQATLEGSVTTRDGGTIPLTMNLVNEEGTWRVLGLTSPLAGAVVGGTGPVAASEVEQADAGAEVGATPPAPSVAEPPVDSEAELPTTQPGAPYAVVENSDLRGRLGRIVVSFPPDADPSGTLIQIRPTGDEEVSASSYGDITADLLPGSYDVTISNVVVPSVEVRSRHDTNVAVGALLVFVGSGTQTEVFSSNQRVASAYGEAKFGLPAGVYEVGIAGQRETVTIDAGRTTEF